MRLLRRSEGTAGGVVEVRCHSAKARTGMRVSVRTVAKAMMVLSCDGVLCRTAVSRSLLYWQNVRA